MSLITAAEAALVELKALHRGEALCLGPKYCPTAAAIANLESEIARAKQEVTIVVGVVPSRTEESES